VSAQDRNDTRPDAVDVVTILDFGGDRTRALKVRVPVDRDR
jgi:hypothetical protein